MGCNHRIAFIYFSIILFLGHLPYFEQVKYVTPFICSLLVLSVGMVLLWQGVSYDHAALPEEPRLADSYINRVEQVLRFYGDDFEDGESGPAKEAMRAMKIWNPRLYQTGSVSDAAKAINRYNCTFQYSPSEYSPEWKCLGPTGKPSGASYTGNGQVHRVVFDPQYDAEKNHTVYCISHFGGLWRSTTEKVDWHNVHTDVQLPFCTVADVSIHPQHSDTLFIATGDGDFGRILGNKLPSLIGGLSIGPTQTSGVYRSFNGGDRWTRIGGGQSIFCDAFSSGGNMRCIRVNPENPSSVLVATTDGIYRTDNALDIPDDVIWKPVLQIPGETEWRGIEFNPDNPSIVYASGENVYRSQDAGVSWKSITDGTYPGLNTDHLPTEVGQLRINVTLTPADPDRVYAEIFALDQDVSCEECKERCPRVKNCKNGSCKLASQFSWIYVFKNNQWHLIREHNTCMITNAEQRRWMGLAASPVNPNHVFTGQAIVHGTSINCTWEELISGEAFQRMSTYNNTGLHADIHDVTFEPIGVQRDYPWLWATTHGGVSQLRLNPELIKRQAVVRAWRRVDRGLQVGTVWDFDQSSHNPHDILLALQDNGVIIHRPDSTWLNVLGGDGYAAMFDPINNDAFIRNQSTVYRFDYETMNKISEDKLMPRDPYDRSRTFMRAFDGAAHPVTDEFYTIFGELYKRKKAHADRKDTPEDLWEIKSDIGKSVGAGWKRMIYSFEISEVNPDIIYLLSTGVDGLPPDTWKSEPALFYSDHGGCTDISEYGDKDDPLTCFTRVDMPDIDPDHPLDTRFPLMTSVAVNPSDPYEVFVTFSGYDPRFKVWSWKLNPASGQGTWKNEDPSGSLNNLPVNQIIYQKGTDGRLYIGTDAGVWIRDEGETNWKRYGDFPNVRVLELRANYCSQKLMASTFGRGVWSGNFLPMSSDYPSSRTLEYGDTSVWNSDRPLFRPLHLKSGSYLELNNSKLIMPANSWIRIDPGATLRLNNSTILNNCNQKWKGIYMILEQSRKGKRVQKMPLLLRDRESRIKNAEQALHFEYE